MWARSWTAILALVLLPGVAFGQRCAASVFCFVTEERDDGLVLYVDNLRPFEVTVVVDATLENAVVDVELPYAATYAAGRRTKVLALRRVDASKAMGYRYTSRWRVGSLSAEHDDAVAYALPNAPGKAHTVMQGFDGAFSHQGIYAVDWEMAERTPIYAARAGVVAEVVDGYFDGGLDDRFKTEANRIMIRHDDATIGGYYHLAKNGAFVRVGQPVARGQVLGVSGSTGYSGGPHLHFEVFRLSADLASRTIPVRFYLGPGRVVQLEAGKAYTAPLR